MLTIHCKCDGLPTHILYFPSNHEMLTKCCFHRIGSWSNSQSTLGERLVPDELWIFKANNSPMFKFDLIPIIKSKCMQARAQEFLKGGSNFGLLG